MMPMKLFQLVLASALVAAAPATVLAQAAAPAAATQGSPSKLVLDNSTRILSTLEQRRAEFTTNRGKLEQFVSGEFNSMFDRDYAARQVLGHHRSEEHTSELQSLMRISYAVFCLKTKISPLETNTHTES